MIFTSILIAYFLVTAPILGALVFKMVKLVRNKNAIDVATTVDQLKLMETKIDRWVLNMEDQHRKLNGDARADAKALLTGVKAITEAMIHIRDSAVSINTDMNTEKNPTPVKNIENFVNSLSYARDRFAATPEEKKVVDSIISNIKTTHGSKTK